LKDRDKRIKRSEDTEKTENGVEKKRKREKEERPEQGLHPIFWDRTISSGTEELEAEGTTSCARKEHSRVSRALVEGGFLTELPQKTEGKVWKVQGEGN